MVSVYSAYDFEGPGECRSCGGGGTVWIRPSGHVFEYPGGPAMGKWTKADYEMAKPQDQVGV